MKGLKVLNKDHWCWQVFICFVLRVFEIGQVYRPWLMSNDILLQILKWWDFVEIFVSMGLKKNILIDVIVYVFDIYQNLLF